jgi:hypothetical protein
MLYQRKKIKKEGTTVMKDGKQDPLPPPPWKKDEVGMSHCRDGQKVLEHHIYKSYSSGTW